jgi:hypothetical protein
MVDTKKTVLRSKTDDFRRVETHVEETAQGASTERVTTVREEVVPMEVKKVIKETVVPVVTSRRVDSYENGDVVVTEHEVVPDESLRLGKIQHGPLTYEDISRAVQEAVRKQMMEVVAPAAKAAPKPPTKFLVVRNEAVEPDVPTPAPKPSFNLGFDPVYILYTVNALILAGIVYLSVLKGWVLNW